MRTIGDELEQHMFKQEMRLFPTMEQGGNTLICPLIEDLHREHVVEAASRFARPPDASSGLPCPTVSHTDKQTADPTP